MSAIESIATPDLADFAQRARIVRVVANLRRQVERDREPGLAALPADNENAGSSPRRMPNPAYCRIVQRRPRYMSAEGRA